MNISNPGPVESWQEVLAEARDQITAATAVKARGGPPTCNSPPGPSSSPKACLEHGLHNPCPLNSTCQWVSVRSGSRVQQRLCSASALHSASGADLRNVNTVLQQRSLATRNAPNDANPDPDKACAGRRAAGAVPAQRDGSAAAAQPGQRHAAETPLYPGSSVRAGRRAAGAVPAQRDGGAAAAQPGQQHAPNDSKHVTLHKHAQGDALLVQYLRDVTAVLQQRSLASGTLFDSNPKPYKVLCAGRRAAGAVPVRRDGGAAAAQPGQQYDSNDPKP